MNNTVKDVAADLEDRLGRPLTVDEKHLAVMYQDDAARRLAKVLSAGDSRTDQEPAPTKPKGVWKAYPERDGDWR